jgi:hypothetical protein
MCGIPPVVYLICALKGGWGGWTGGLAVAGGAPKAISGAMAAITIMARTLITASST